ncbi:type II CRISPR-associated endonuclease Cas1 [Rhodosalinus halophilus]|uniref:Type II CRISPR-associated endonuclease Cas1 n=1 Tax=Rhodosalinus halophilus TaxID=2259333 RepID=A0A365U5C4_9RHOB|nr:type II CRISPR-associated endonuclease Cas1 [Rhodosalinus halophilus]
MAYRSFGRVWQVSAPATIRRLLRPHHPFSSIAQALDRIGQPSERLRRLLTAVRSGDPDNREAQAAQAYWPLMMGRDFRRDRGADGANAMLNYGYAVLRAATVRAIVSAGLHPSLSVHHRSGGDALALADDLMEPFRSTVDLIVHRLRAEGRACVEDAREDLVACLSADFPTRNGATPLSQVLVRLAQSLARSFLDRKLKLDFPSRPLPDVVGETEHA